MHGTANDDDQQNKRNLVVKMGRVDAERCGVYLWYFEGSLLDPEDRNTSVGSVCVWRSDWTGPLGDLDFEGIREEVLNAIARLSTNLDPRNYDLSGVGPGEDITGDENVPYKHSRQVLRSSVSYLTLTQFRSRLIEHFDLSIHRNDIVWPSRQG